MSLVVEPTIGPAEEDNMVVVLISLGEEEDVIVETSIGTLLVVG